MWKGSNEKAKIVVENICPYCNKTLVMNKRSFANHVRWCEKNPKIKENKEHHTKLFTQLINQRYDEQLGKKKEFNVICANPKCGKEFTVIEREKKFPQKEKYFCCRSCANTRTRSEESKKKASESLKKYARTQRRNVKSDLFEIERKCAFCGKSFHSIKKKQKFCSVKCIALDRQIRVFREKFENLEGDEERLKLMFNAYKKACLFIFDVFDYKEEFDMGLIYKYGWYSPKNKKNNLSGVSKDHKFSIKNGFIEHVDPYYISHPANCELLIQNVNSSKGDECSLTKEELIENVERWNKKYGVYNNTIDYNFLKEIGLVF